MKKDFSIKELFEGIKNGDRIKLARAITLVESQNPKHQDQAQELISLCLPFSGNSIRIGITGVPGVGKSTFIEALGLYTIEQGSKLAVLAIDPSSQKSHGSILGDKTRMNELSANKNAFIRPTPSAGSLGGVAKATNESIVLFEAAGFDTIFIETVGVGQSETAVKNMVDCFVLLLLAGAGDELQGIKRGIMEMAELLVINKADGDNLDAAKKATAQLENALHLFPMAENEWLPQVLTCSALHNQNIDGIWSTVQRFIEQQKIKGYFESTRLEQSKYWLHAIIEERLKYQFYRDPKNSTLLKKLENEIKAGKISAYQAVNQIFK